MKHFLLLHGSWHGAWCWYKVAPLLRTHGAVSVPNLLGRGRDPAWAPGVTLKRLMRHAAAQLPADQRTTVVAHSRYGILATALAEAFPDRVARVIYLASYMLPHGDRVADHFAKDRDSLIRQHVQVSRSGCWDKLSPEVYREGLYADCSEEDVALASSLLCREPSLPALARVRTSAERFGRVPTAYIRLTQDRAVLVTEWCRAEEASVATAGGWTGSAPCCFGRGCCEAGLASTTSGPRYRPASNATTVLRYSSA